MSLLSSQLELIWHCSMWCTQGRFLLFFPVRVHPRKSFAHYRDRQKTQFNVNYGRVTVRIIHCIHTVLRKTLFAQYSDSVVVVVSGHLPVPSECNKHPHRRRLYINRKRTPPFYELAADFKNFRFRSDIVVYTHTQAHVVLYVLSQQK